MGERGDGRDTQRIEGRENCSWGVLYERRIKVINNRPLLILIFLTITGEILVFHAPRLEERTERVFPLQ